MTKCPKCGYWDPYWLKMAYDREGEYCKVDDLKDEQLIPFLQNLKIHETVEIHGFMYGRSKKYFTRLPTEIFKARGNRWQTLRNVGYWDGINFARGHRRIANEKLTAFDSE